jgi:hypothetical protein
MADLDFETQLSRLYGQAPVYSRRRLFAQQVTDKLDRGWALRRCLDRRDGRRGRRRRRRPADQRAIRQRVLPDVAGRAHQLLQLDKLTHRYDQLFTLGGSETLWLGVALAGLAWPSPSPA